LLSKSRNYYYDADAIAELTVSDHPSANRFIGRHDQRHGHRGTNTGWNDIGGRRNRRDVWLVASDKSSEAHYAAFPGELVRLCVLAGSRPGDLVLDPFAGSGTVAEVCSRLGRGWIGLELAGDYATMACRRVAQAGLPFKPHRIGKYR
jgi:site-specific DNA-methyltransferase (cytosine-N4-specific)